MQLAGYALDPSWFAPHFEFRFPKLGEFAARGVHVSVRGALEPWHVMGEEGAPGGTVRFCGLVARAHRTQGHRPSSTHAMCSRSTASPSRCNPPAASANSWPACATAPGCHPQPCTPPSASTPCSPSTWWTAGCSGLYGGCRYHVAHPVTATTAPCPSTPTRPRAAASPASSPSATRQDASRPASPCAAWVPVHAGSAQGLEQPHPTSLRSHSDGWLTLGVPLGPGGAQDLLQHRGRVGARREAEAQHQLVGLRPVPGSSCGLATSARRSWSRPACSMPSHSVAWRAATLFSSACASSCCSPGPGPTAAPSDGDRPVHHVACQRPAPQPAQCAAPAPR